MIQRILKSVRPNHNRLAAASNVPCVFWKNAMIISGIGSIVRVFR